MSHPLDTYQDRIAGFNSVLPTKIYGIWGNRYSAAGTLEAVKLDEVSAEDVHQALIIGRGKFGGEARSAILIRGRR